MKDLMASIRQQTEPTPTYTRWEDMPREDLQHIPMMQARGWSPVFSYRDRQAGNVIPEKCPHDQVGFKKGNKELWESGTSYPRAMTWWNYDELVDNRYQNHQHFNVKHPLWKEGVQFLLPEVVDIIDPQIN